MSELPESFLVLEPDVPGHVHGHQATSNLTALSTACNSETLIAMALTCIQIGVGMGAACNRNPQ